MDEQHKTASRPGVLTAFRAEAEAIGPPSTIYTGSVDEHEAVVYGMSGMGPSKAAACVETMAAKGVGTLYNLGFCGGLSPDIRCGDILVYDALVEESSGKILPISQELLFTHFDLLTACGLSFHHGRALCSGEPVLSTELKRELWERTSALCVDMESVSILEAAEKHGIKTAILRVVLDDADTSIPEYAMDLVDSYGAPRPAQIAKKLALNPWRIGALLRMAKQQKAAASSLASLWQCLRQPKGPFSGADWS
jgi:nucleoside phosphorylase